MRETVNALLARESLLMLYVTNKTVYWCVKHYRYLNRAEMLLHKAPLGPCVKNLNLKQGFNYITEPLTF